MNQKLSNILFKYENGKISEWINIKQDSEQNGIFKNSRNDFIVTNENNELIFLEYLNPIVNYEVPLTSKILLIQVHLLILVNL